MLAAQIAQDVQEEITLPRMTAPPTHGGRENIRRGADRSTSLGIILRTRALMVTLIGFGPEADFIFLVVASRIATLTVDTFFKGTWVSSKEVQEVNEAVSWFLE